MIKVLNVKENNKYFEYAIHLINSEIVNKTCNVLIVIHGYGSGGMGGIMRAEIHKYLSNELKLKNILSFIKGEEWGETNTTKGLMCEFYPELLLNQNLQNYNNGVTVIWVTKENF